MVRHRAQSTAILGMISGVAFAIYCFLALYATLLLASLATNKLSSTWQSFAALGGAVSRLMPVILYVTAWRSELRLPPQKRFALVGVGAMSVVLSFLVMCAASAEPESGMMVTFQRYFLGSTLLRPARASAGRREAGTARACRSGSRFPE